jgi:hypothetical protein
MSSDEESPEEKIKRPQEWKSIPKWEHAGTQRDLKPGTSNLPTRSSQTLMSPALNELMELSWKTWWDKMKDSQLGTDQGQLQSALN